MKRKDYVLIFLLVALDQFTKLFISSRMSLFQSIEVIRDFFYITYVRNDGAAFSVLSGQRWFFVLLAVGAVVFMLVYAAKNSMQPIEKTALLLIVAGALGNVVDRMIYGTVVDFLDFVIFGYDFPVFNVADICITIGVGLMVLSVLFCSKGKTE